MLMFLMLWPNAITYQADQGKDIRIIIIDFLLARGEKRARGGAREKNYHGFSFFSSSLAFAYHII